MIPLQEKVLGTLLGARLGLVSMADGGSGSMGLSVALQGLEKLADRVGVAAMGLSLLPSLRSTDSAEIILAALPAIFLEFAEGPELLAEQIVRAVGPQADAARIASEVLYGTTTMATLLRSPFPAGMPAGLVRVPPENATGGVTQALRLFCETANDYRSCLQRAARQPKVTPAIMALTGAFLGAYQGVRGIPLSWQLALVRNGIWSQYERLALVATAHWEGRSPRFGSAPGFQVVGPVGSLQARAALRMPSWS